ncbi:MAG: aminodeoxychorismate synthase component I [Candidatus Omnitrophica bacterium]|nr:aminodeoxychorismate synthase component I [Candidatus Omnitrophota bacterium]
MRYYRLPVINSDYLKDYDYFLLFETSLCDESNFTSYIFIHPFKIIRINRYQDVERTFQEIEEYAKDYYLAGYFAYELGYYFEKNLFSWKPYSFPLIHLCVFDKVITFDHRTGRFNKDIHFLFTPSDKQDDFRLKDLRLNFTFPQYKKRIQCIKEYIRLGWTYQVNFTAKFNFDFFGSAFCFYQDLKNRQNVPYGAFCKFKDEYILSLSPELFFRRDGFKIYSKPMKGTIRRGRDIEEDKERIKELRNSPKERAENLMIVDLIRNDLGKISVINSVKVTRLFEIEKYATLFQMTSTVESTLKKDITYFDLFKSIFPGGSVTGAPKLRTMQIIKELEGSARGVYCGALGIIFPRKKAIFNLPIRTIRLKKDKAEMGVGSGIVIDADVKTEFRECLLKAKFLTRRYKEFKLMETILWDKGYKFLNAHLRRMKNSSLYFDFYFDDKKIISCLKDTENFFDHSSKYRVRILLDKEGRIEIDYSLITEDILTPKYIAISRYRTSPEDIFLYHKTTHRLLYNREYKFYRAQGYFDVIFLNTRGEVTEGAISNIIIKKDKNYYTPPVAAGLLPGIFRQHLIRRYKVKEKTLTLKDLRAADKIFLCNSVRGLNEVSIR